MDHNKAKPVAGPKIKEPVDPKMAIKEPEHMAKVLKSFSKDELHEGHIESPLKALAGQAVIGGKSGMAKGMRMPMPKGMGRSVAKVEMYKEKEKDKY